MIALRMCATHSPDSPESLLDRPQIEAPQVSRVSFFKIRTSLSSANVSRLFEPITISHR